MVDIGQKIENHNFLLHDGSKATLKDLSNGKDYLIIYFYPKDDTPGCTAEACSIRDNYSKLKEHAAIVGVSGDSLGSHVKFIQKYSLPFPLISDPDLALTKALGAYGKKKMGGGMGLIRSTFIISTKDFSIISIFGLEDFPKVTTASHANQLLEVLNKH
jgi:peroxiredoxin Q/BCP